MNGIVTYSTAENQLYLDVKTMIDEARANAVRMTLPEDNATIIANKYELYLPSKEQLVDEVEEGKRKFGRQQQLKADGEE